MQFELVGAVRGVGVGVVGAGHLPERVVAPGPVRLRAGEGRARGGDRCALGNRIHGISVTGNHRAASAVFDLLQRVARALVGAVGNEGGVGGGDRLGPEPGGEVSGGVDVGASGGDKAVKVFSS
jgi:hypothetical protein